jgi:hypothetical protein
MATTNTIPADDIRNPSFYEIRAGYPKATEEFYYGLDKDGNRTPPRYCKEYFGCGFNLRCDTFYRLRHKIARGVLEKGCTTLIWLPPTLIGISTN